MHGSVTSRPFKDIVKHRPTKHQQTDMKGFIEKLHFPIMHTRTVKNRIAHKNLIVNLAA